MVYWIKMTNEFEQEIKNEKLYIKFCSNEWRKNQQNPKHIKSPKIYKNKHLNSISDF